MEKDRISYHESVLKAYEKIKREGITNIWDRYEAQGMGGNPDQRCPFCQAGVRCDLCSNGPCRADVEKDKRGVCGITGDGMAMRMMLLRNILGASTYQFHAGETIKTLKSAVEGKGFFKIREKGKLLAFAQRFNIPDLFSEEEILEALINYFERDFSRKHDEESHVVQSLAPRERIKCWREIGILPGGILNEIILSAGSCLTNVDGYYVSLALKALRLSIAMAYQSQILIEYGQDILFGIPFPHSARIDLGVLDPEYVNILPNGHEPFLAFALVEVAKKEKWQDLAKKKGAKGIRIIGNIETGQEMIHRWKVDEIFYGFTGNWIMQEAVLSSGCCDLFLCDMNCSMPIDPIYAEKYGFRLIPSTPLVSFEGVKDRVDYNPTHVEGQAEILLEMAIENFSQRKKEIGTERYPLREAITGFSQESIFQIFGGDGLALVKAIKDGMIKGIAGLVSCTSLRDKGHDIHTVRIAKELIKRDILILSMGCGNAALQLAGLCSKEAKDFAGEGLKLICERYKIPPVLSFGTCTHMGVFADFLSSLSFHLDHPIPSLPFVFVAPEYMEQKATIDATFALAFGLFTYVNPVPTITGAPNLLKLLTQGLKEVTGGRLCMEKDYIRVAELISEEIMERRSVSKLK